jgi:hypothetical protein
MVHPVTEKVVSYVIKNVICYWLERPESVRQVYD